jgi:hypothetical protein
MVVGGQDTMVGERFALSMWTKLDAAPLDRRDYVRFNTDLYGVPALRADHSLPATDGDWGPLNAFDWFGTWKLFDLLAACGFDGVGCDRALGNTPEQRFMGAWSDGTPVTELTVTDDPTR